MDGEEEGSKACETDRGRLRLGPVKNGDCTRVDVGLGQGEAASACSWARKRETKSERLQSKLGHERKNDRREGKRRGFGFLRLANQRNERKILVRLSRANREHEPGRRLDLSSFKWEKGFRMGYANGIQPRVFFLASL
ncbi:hypothetical protein KFK09_006847 [Dendrobium nobile]|uniref:Uncharacterized protein n=1 Tax=Dendrobium nobile TaxID=94219 RepID=A0A8T3BUR0_DENNO|nr:hypothetical protein KFK09_006847 [Dendrobium nobile]